MTHALAAPPLLVNPETASLGEESDLIRRTQQRDMQAFERLYRLHVARVHALCLRMTANVTRAEELTQQAFVRVWEKIEGFRGESAFASWLHRLTVNTVLLELRSERRRHDRVFGTDDLEAFEQPGHTPAPGMQVDLDQAIAGLPKQARLVFVLHDVEGYRHEEISAMMGIATGTTKAQLHRARQLLREVLL